MKTGDNPKMGQNLFKYLPSAIIINILSRLPTRTAMECKCVCKPWLGLLATPEFVNAHMSRSVPGIAVESRSPHSCKIIEFVDELDLNFDEKCSLYAIFNFDKKHRWEVAFNFRIPFDGYFISSANGLIFLRDFEFDHDDLILWNPITRDYIKLPCPRQTSPKVRSKLDNFGFGVSGTTGQYKVVRIFAGTPQRREGFKNACQVYTVGTGTWRNVPFGKPLRFCDDTRGVHLNGNLHWMVAKTTKGFCRWIHCFNIETELFSTFCAPPPCGRNILFGRSLCVLRDCLCISDISHYGCDLSDKDQGSDLSDKDEGCDLPTEGCVIIWSMKEDDHTWTKIFVIPEVERLAGIGHIWPIRIFENGDALMEWDDGMIFYYSKETENVYLERLSVEDHDPSTIMYASSFVSLKSFVKENVSSY